MKNFIEKIEEIIDECEREDYSHESFRGQIQDAFLFYAQPMNREKLETLFKGFNKIAVTKDGGSIIVYQQEPTKNGIETTTEGYKVIYVNGTKMEEFNFVKWGSVGDFINDVRNYFNLEIK